MNRDWQILVENSMDLRKVIDRLTPGDRAFLILVCNGLTRFEIACLVGALANKNITVDAIHQRASRIRKRIITILQEEKETE